MSVAVSKDIIVTAGFDKYLRVFEYPGSQHYDNLSGGAGGGGPGAMVHGATPYGLN